MEYFIFKDIHSDDLVKVESLPPPVKPPKRYNTKEYDGSSITRFDILGYKAYTKPVKIWFPDKNIQNAVLEVMDWLDGEGNLILSNEPDKYYKAIILDQIDYEKAIRYNMATVNFVVQPFKYALGEEDTTSRVVINQGNINCLPLMTITGSGVVNVLVNGIKACTVNINGYITLDSEEQDAYKGTVLQNRSMTGDFPELVPGENNITFTGSGTVTETKILVRSRWI